MVTGVPTAARGRIYLASQSPRRRELLEQVGIAYDVIEVAVDETPQEGESVEVYAVRLARAKAETGWRRLGATPARPPQPVLGADTVVVIDDEILGKPVDRDAALAMLARLSGRTHRVLTAVALCDGTTAHRLSETRVVFRPLSSAEARAYWDTGEPADKAGAYGIQGRGAIFVTRIEGSYSGVVGLPLYETVELLTAAGIRVL